MKIDTECINHNVVRLITELTEDAWGTLDGEHLESERGNVLMILGEVRGVLMLAYTLKEVIRNG